MTSTRSPREVRAPTGARVLEIDWDDGATTRYRHLILRGFCPCAECQGHQGPIEWVEGTETGAKDTLELSTIDEVGSYALQLGWADGHRTGIYSFRYLRELAQLDGVEEDEVRSQRFAR